MKGNRVLITGMACATSAGLSKSDLGHTLQDHTYQLKTEYGKIGAYDIRTVGIINRNSPQLAGYYKDNNVDDFSTALLLYLSEQALHDASISCPLPAEDDLTMILGSTYGYPLDYMGLQAFRQQQHKNPGDPVLKDLFQLRFREDTYTRHIQKYLGCGLQKFSINMQCTSSILAILLAVSQVKNKEIPRVLVGGYDFFTPSIYLALRQAGIITENYADPYGANHQGFNFGEGAAFLVLENEHDARKRGLTRCYGEVVGGSVGCYPVDGEPSLPGIIKTVGEALKNAGIQPQEVDFISPQGGGIPDMDRAESIALEKYFGPLIHNIPMAVYSPFIGYSFAASGFLDIIALLDGMQNGRILAGYKSGKVDAVSDFNFFPGDVGAAPIKNIFKLKLGYSGSIGGLVISPFKL